MAHYRLRCCWAWGQDVLFVHCLNWAEAIAWATWTQEPALEGGGGAAAAPRAARDTAELPGAMPIARAIQESNGDQASRVEYVKTMHSIVGDLI